MNEMKNILITGASRGIGLLTAKTLAAKGHYVLASMRNVNTQNAGVAAELTQWASANNHNLEVVELDVTDEDSVNRAIQTLEARVTIDVVINNAGIMPCGITEAFTPEQMAACFDVNVVGVGRVCRAVLPHMRHRKNGLIIHVSSNSGRLAMPFFGLYCSSKWALEALAESMHYELSPFGIESILVEPGGHETDLIDNPPSPKDLECISSYGEIAEAPDNLKQAFRDMFAQKDSSTDAQNVADKIASLVCMSAPRPIRSSVGHDMGIDEINRLSRPVQANFIDAFMPLANVPYNTDNRLFVKATIQFKPEFAEQGINAIKQIMPQTLQEAGCQLFTLMKDNDDQKKVHLFEIFDNQDALDHHYEQDYTKAVFAQYEQWLSTPIEVSKMHAASPLTSEQL
ncbi:SDR family NAD(P)-dependent oxidoreductase [Alteromonadaceae bacterium M269]|nr:SDR family NAD(P)-dependent oxidoreductase [Alteromonadaceae bacterium M269]